MVHILTSPDPTSQKTSKQRPAKHTKQENLYFKSNKNPSHIHKLYWNSTTTPTNNYKNTPPLQRRDGSSSVFSSMYFLTITKEKKETSRYCSLDSAINLMPNSYLAMDVGPRSFEVEPFNIIIYVSFLCNFLYYKIISP